MADSASIIIDDKTFEDVPFIVVPGADGKKYKYKYFGEYQTAQNLMSKYSQGDYLIGMWDSATNMPTTTEWEDVISKKKMSGTFTDIIKPPFNGRFSSEAEFNVADNGFTLEVCYNGYYIPIVDFGIGLGKDGFGVILYSTTTNQTIIDIQSLDLLSRDHSSDSFFFTEKMSGDTSRKSINWYDTVIRADGLAESGYTSKTDLHKIHTASFVFDLQDIFHVNINGKRSNFALRGEPYYSIYYEGTSPIFIGHKIQTSDDADSVFAYRIYNRPLTDEECTANYNTDVERYSKYL